jgi:hypothetical protein
MMIWRTLKGFFQYQEATAQSPSEPPPHAECCSEAPGGPCPNEGIVETVDENDDFDPFAESRHDSDEDRLRTIYQGTPCEGPYEEVLRSRKRMLTEAAQITKMVNDSNIYKIKAPDED